MCHIHDHDAEIPHLNPIAPFSDETGQQAGKKQLIPLVRRFALRLVYHKPPVTRSAFHFDIRINISLFIQCHNVNLCIVKGLEYAGVWRFTYENQSVILQAHTSSQKFLFLRYTHLPDYPCGLPASPRERPADNCHSTAQILWFGG